MVFWQLSLYLRIVKQFAMTEMKKVILLVLILAAAVAPHAEKIYLRNPEYFKQPVRDGYPLYPDSLVADSETETLHIQNIGMIGRLGEYGFKNLKRSCSGMSITFREGCLRRCRILKK